AEVEVGRASLHHQPEKAIDGRFLDDGSGHGRRRSHVTDGIGGCVQEVERVAPSESHPDGKLENSRQAGRRIDPNWAVPKVALEVVDEVGVTLRRVTVVSGTRAGLIEDEHAERSRVTLGARG
ncbi:MAG: hypothetical protein ACR2LU_00805, partial [Luteitalea sp.]